MDVLDNGGVTTGTTATGTTTAATTSPSWFSSLTSAITTGAADYTTLAPLINGKPAGSTAPIAPGGAVGVSATPGTLLGVSVTTWIVIALAGFGGWFFFLRKKRR